MSRLKRAVADFNTTSVSDIFVVNFGAHYHDTAEGDASFRAEMAPILHDMARLGETATVIWRYYLAWALVVLEVHGVATFAQKYLLTGMQLMYILDVVGCR